MTETWLQEDTEMAEIIQELDAGHGLFTFLKNRPTAAANGRKYGGVAIITNQVRASYKPFPLANPLDYEVVAATTKMKGIGRVAIIGAYMPPNMPAAGAHDCIEYISDLIGELKRKYEDCNVIVAGDFNQWPIERLLNEHPDMKEVAHGPTRND